MEDEVPIFSKWVAFLEWLLPVTEKFPKRIRFTLTQRVENLALDVLEDLVEARYSRHKNAPLTRANLRLEKMRVLLRIGYQQRHLPSRQYEHGVRSLYEIGNMLGGWRKQQAKAKP